MNIDVERMVELEREAADANGEFALFALFLREEGLGQWDVVVAAPWIEQRDRYAVLEELSKRLVDKIGAEAMLNISKIVIVDLKQVSTDVLPVTGRPVEPEARWEAKDCEFFGMPMQHAVVIKAKDLKVSNGSTSLGKRRGSASKRRARASDRREGPGIH